MPSNFIPNRSKSAGLTMSSLNTWRIWNFPSCVDLSREDIVSNTLSNDAYFTVQSCSSIKSLTLLSLGYDKWVMSHHEWSPFSTRPIGEILKVDIGLRLNRPNILPSSTSFCNLFKVSSLFSSTETIFFKFNGRRGRVLQPKTLRESRDNQIFFRLFMI